MLERGDGWDVREHRSRGWLLMPTMRNVSRITLEPNRRLSFRLIEGDWSRSDGEWTLTPIDGGRGTHVTYRISAALAGGAPVGIPQSQLINSVRSTLAALRPPGQPVVRTGAPDAAFVREVAPDQVAFLRQALARAAG